MTDAHHQDGRTKSERRARRRRPGMKVSGAHVRKLQRLIAARQKD